MFSTLICFEKINKFPFSSSHRTPPVKYSESSPLISFSGNFDHKPSSPYFQQWNNEKGYIFLSKFNLDDEWLIQTGSKKNKIQFSSKFVPFYFLDDTTGNITLESNNSENLVLTVGYLNDWNTFYVSNENKDTYTFNEDRYRRSDYYPNYYLVSYTEKVDIQLSLSGPGVENGNFNIDLYVDEKKYSSVLKGTYVYKNVSSIFISAHVLNNGATTFEITKLNSTTTNPTIPCSGYLNFSAFDYINVFDTNPYKITNVDEIRPISSQLDMNSSDPFFFHSPLYFNPNQTFNYYQTSDIIGTNSTFSYSTMYSKNIKPFHFFENKFGRFISPGSDERIIERYGNLPDCSLYYITNSFESDIYIGNYDIESGTDFCVLISLPTKFSLNYSYSKYYYYSSGYDYWFTAYVNDKTYKIGQINGAFFSGITDFLLRVNCVYYYYGRYSKTPTINIHLTNESDSIQNSTIPFKGVFNKYQLEANNFSSFVTFSGNTTFDKSKETLFHEFNRRNGFHLINSYSGSIEKVRYDYNHYTYYYDEKYPSYHDLTIIKNSPFVKFGYEGNITVKTGYSSTTLSHLCGFLNFTGPIFISNTNEKEYIFTNDYPKENFSILISYSEETDINITIQSESNDTTFKIQSNNSLFSITGDKNLSIKDASYILIIIINDISSQGQNWHLKISRNDKVLEKPTFPMNKVVYICENSNFDSLSLMDNVDLFQNITRESLNPKTKLFENYSWDYQYYLLNIFDVKQSFKFGLGGHYYSYANIKFKRTDRPIFYFDTYGGNYSSQSKGGFMASTSGRFLKSPNYYPVYISNLNRDYYEFFNATYRQFLITFPQQVDLEITISPLDYGYYSDPYTSDGTIIAVDHQTYRGNSPSTLIFRNVNALYILNRNLSGPMKIHSLTSITQNYTLKVEGYFDYKKLTSNWPGKYKSLTEKYWYIWFIVIPIGFLLLCSLISVLAICCEQCKERKIINQTLLQDEEKDFEQTEEDRNDQITEKQNHKDQIDSKIRQEEIKETKAKEEAKSFVLNTNQGISPYEQSDEVCPYNTLNSL